MEMVKHNISPFALNPKPRNKILPSLRQGCCFFQVHAQVIAINANGVWIMSKRFTGFDADA
jgi:hypothetical protein